MSNPADQCAGHDQLVALAVWPRQAGFDARVLSWPGDGPYLRVVSTASKDLAETIKCGPRATDDAASWFFWSWGDPMCPADELEIPVTAIKKVLAEVK